MSKHNLSRRSLLQGIAAVGAGMGLSSLADAKAYHEPTIHIPDDDEPTLPVEEGPFFKPKSPERRSMKNDAKGSVLVVEGQVVSTSGQPIAGALLDFWHCDASGQYDNTGFKLRGHQYTDKDGRYRLETIEPGVYPGRTKHIHVKAQAPKGTILTTQLFFPQEERNGSDRLYTPKLEIKIAEKDGVKAGKFDFVLRTS